MTRSKMFKAIVEIITEEMGLDEEDMEQILKDGRLVDYPIYADLSDIDTILYLIEEEFEVDLDTETEKYEDITIEMIMDKLEEALA